MVAVQVVSGDITQVAADALITPVNSAGEWYGAVDFAIRRVAGERFHTQAKARLPLGGNRVIAVTGRPRELMFSNVIFVIDDLDRPLFEVVKDGLEAAEANGYRHVTLPVMRTGAASGEYETRPLEAYQSLVYGIQNFTPRACLLEKITIVVYNDSEAFESLTGLVEQFQRA